MATLKDNYEALIEGLEQSADKKVGKVRKEAENDKKQFQKSIDSLTSKINSTVNSVDKKIEEGLKTIPTLNNRFLSSELYKDGKFNLQVPPTRRDFTIEMEDATYTLDYVTATELQNWVDASDDQREYDLYWAKAENKVTYGELHSNDLIYTIPGDLMLVRIDLPFTRSFSTGLPIEAGDYWEKTNSSYDTFEKNLWYQPYQKQYMKWKIAADYIIPLKNADENYYYGLRTILLYKYANLNKEKLDISGEPGIPFMAVSISNVTDIKFTGLWRSIDNPKENQYLNFNYPVIEGDINTNIQEESSSYINVTSVYSNLEARYKNAFIYNYDIFPNGGLQMRESGQTNYSESVLLVTNRYYETYDYAPQAITLKLYVSQSYMKETVGASTVEIGNEQTPIIGELVPQGSYSNDSLVWKKVKKFSQTDLDELLNENNYTIKFSPQTITYENLNSIKGYNASLTGNFTYNGQTYSVAYPDSGTYISAIFNNTGTIRNKNVKSTYDLVAYLPLTITKDGTTYEDKVQIPLYYGGRFQNVERNTYKYNSLFGFLSGGTQFTDTDKIVEVYFTEGGAYIDIANINDDRDIQIYTVLGSVTVAELNSSTVTKTGTFSLPNSFFNNADKYKLSTYIKFTLSLSDASQTPQRVYYAKFADTIYKDGKDWQIYKVYIPQQAINSYTIPERNLEIEIAVQSGDTYQYKWTLSEIKSGGPIIYTLPTITLSSYSTDKILGQFEDPVTDNVFDTIRGLSEQELINSILKLTIIVGDNFLPNPVIYLRYTGTGYANANSTYFFTGYWSNQYLTGTTLGQIDCGNRNITVGVGSTNMGDYYEIMPELPRTNQT